ncbi:ABC transporter ATP-binding protein [Clostridium chrysemydis]|uniref:ABC transporter ATP-binding protein n=1 Tax=Clostridium chrysemydis TaxID=2665504 RepID=UPI0018839C7A|nr:ATP-binding cassette domain-containing protein [Clostridium chrysemydis]
MIKVNNINKEFKIKKKEKGLKGAMKSLFTNDFELKKVVSDISFDINKGEVVGYIGANGAGKSTTIKMMTGILTPTAGEIIVDGIVPYKEREKNAINIGVVFGQRTQLWWDLALRETFDILKDIYSISDSDFDRSMKFLNEVLELEEFIDRPVRMLSLGQRMRADLAASLIHNPKILYLDEPTIGLDIVVKENVRKAIKRINKEFGTTVILTTHDLSDIEELCERIIIIDKGKKIYDGSLDKIKERFGYITTLDISFKNKEENISCDSLRNLFKIGNDELKLKLDGEKISIKYNKNLITSSDILYKLMQKIYVNDFKILESSIEDIIKKIYREGMTEYE